VSGEDLRRVEAALAEAGVAGAQDFGRFVNNTEFFAPSTIDERAAMPVLLALLPCLTDSQVVAAAARHLRRPWARPIAFDGLLAAFDTWASREPTGAGWHLGEALATAADKESVPALLERARERRYGKARQMIVAALWRFRKDDPQVGPALRDLCSDPDVCLHAMSAYRRTVGPKEALPLLRSLQNHTDPLVARTAAQQAKKAEKAIAPSDG
jgi:HEAT repeat protein